MQDGRVSYFEEKINKEVYGQWAHWLRDTGTPNPEDHEKLALQAQ